MARRLKPRPVQGVTIDANTVYTRRELPALLRMSLRYLHEEIISGRLRSDFRTGRRLFRGAWLLAWLEAAPAGQIEV